jgi:hypothetical protein
VRREAAEGQPRGPGIPGAEPGHDEPRVERR